MICAPAFPPGAEPWLAQPAFGLGGTLDSRFADPSRCTRTVECYGCRMQDVAGEFMPEEAWMAGLGRVATETSPPDEGRSVRRRHSLDRRESAPPPREAKHTAPANAFEINILTSRQGRNRANVERDFRPAPTYGARVNAWK